MQYILYTFLFLLFLVNPLFADAKEISPTSIPTPTPVEYSLPYPGILPGHPFYFLKQFRDSVLGFMISSPLKKAEFELLQADKNLQAAVYLSEQKKSSEVVFETLHKAQDYFARAITKTQEAQRQGIETVEFAAKITIASLKHQEIVLNLSKSAKGDDKKKFELELEKIKELGAKAKALSPK